MRSRCLALLLLAAPAFTPAQAPADQDAPPRSITPPEGPPTELPPPPPPLATNAPAPAPPQAAPPAAAPSGQWVNTDQYGWLWMPYDRQYTYVPADLRAFPDMYVYYPAYGWRWVVAPWVYGYGPAPYWGTSGPRYFVWYSRPWFRVGGYWGWGGYRTWGHYSGWIGPQRWGPHGWASAPAYYRTGVGGPHPVRVVRDERAHAEQKRAGSEHREHER